MMPTNDDRTNDVPVQAAPSNSPADNTAPYAPTSPDTQTQPPRVPPPLTSNTGTGFDAPDAGTTLPNAGASTGAGTVTPLPATDLNATPQPGNVDRDALAGENASPGAQADAEAIDTTSNADLAR